jgi:CHAD domain-containing protein
MPPDSRPRDRRSDPSLQTEWQRQVGLWRGAFDQCIQKSSRKRVHDLRISTLRLQSALEHWLTEQAPDAAGARAARRWKVQGKKLRRVLEPVREADVYLQRLGSLRAHANESTGRKLQCSRRCLREIGVLEDRLKERRQAAAEELRSEIEDRRKRLDRRSQEMAAALGTQKRRTGNVTAKAVIQRFAEMAIEFKDLNGGNLHAYRKHLKKLRYLVETGANPQAKRLAVTFKKMQDAVGDWHDWQMLAKEAERVLSGKEDGLAALLGMIAEDALQNALGVCRRSTARLLKSGGVKRPSVRQ